MAPNEQELHPQDAEETGGANSKNTPTVQNLQEPTKHGGRGKYFLPGMI